MAFFESTEPPIWKRVIRMTVFNLKKRFIISLVLLTLSLSLFVLASWGWFTQLFEEDQSYTVGNVDVEIIPYFVDENNNPILDEFNEYILPPYFEMTTGVLKPGVYGINIVDAQEPYYFQDLRVLVRVKSSVLTYVRVKIYEQLTWRYYNSSNILTEVAVIDEDGMPYMINSTDWFDDRYYVTGQPVRELSYYIYTKTPVIRDGVDLPNEIDFILGSTELYQDYIPGYYFQISFQVEAVQSSMGPQNVWGLAKPPWGGEW